MRKVFHTLLGIISGVILGTAVVCVIGRVGLSEIWEWLRYGYGNFLHMFLWRFQSIMEDMPQWQLLLIFGISILWGLQGASRQDTVGKVIFYPIVMLIRLVFGIIKLVLGIALMAFIFGALVLIFDALGILHIVLGCAIGFGLLLLLCGALDDGCDALLIIFK